MVLEAERAALASGHLSHRRRSTRPTRPTGEDSARDLPPRGLPGKRKCLPTGGLTGSCLEADRHHPPPRRPQDGEPTPSDTLGCADGDPTAQKSPRPARHVRLPSFHPVDPSSPSRHSSGGRWADGTLNSAGAISSPGDVSQYEAGACLCHPG